MNVGVLSGRLGRVCKVLGISILFTTLATFFYSFSRHARASAGGLYRPNYDNKFTLSQSQLENLDTPKIQNATSQERRLRVFMPADGPNINLCKTIMSSVALGYPLPTLLNWDGDFNRKGWHFGGSHIAKLESLLAVIEELLTSSEDADEDDLALMVDAYDIWFQLPPSVLIQRYYQLNREADERNRKLWEESNALHASFPLEPPRQSIIVTGAKDCQPGAESGSDPHYDLWPQSPMPLDLYGDQTDKDQFAIFDTSHRFARIRPRCVNSGMIMGTMGAMRDALRRAQDKVNNVARAGRQLWSDQALFAEVQGDQEAWRAWTRELASTWNGSVATSPESTRHDHVESIAAAALRGERFEFGIGLDYNFTTIPPTCSSEDDGDFVEFGDKPALAAKSYQAGVRDHVRLTSLPPELDAALELKEGPLSDLRWDLKPLYSDLFFGVTPVGIHHNAYKNGLKPWRLKHWWHRMWFYPMLRELITYSLAVRKKEERTLLEMEDGARFVAPQEEFVTVFKPGSEAVMEVIGWDGVCQKGSTPWYDELLGDGQGTLVL